MINAGTVAAYLTLDTEKFDKGMKSANAQLKALGDSELPTAKRLQGVGSALTEMGVTMTKNLTVPLVGAGIAAVKMNSDYESAFAGVRKTVDATEEEYQKLSDSIIDMSKKMPTAATEIAGVMEAAGQLGIEKDSLESFTKTMVMLGDSTNLSANGAASALAKFANVTDMSANDYGRLGSTIVELGNNFATTESDIVEMGTRLASTGNLVGLSQPQIMAVSTALSSCGIEAEAGGSAVSKMLKKIDVAVKTFEKSSKVIDSTGYSLRELELLADQDSKSFKSVAASLGLTSDELKNYMSHAKDLNAFSDVAGVSAEKFVQAWGEDAVGALGMFIDGLNDTERNGRTAVEILDEMGITEVRMSNAVLSLASSNGILTESVDLANAAWNENTALSHEAEQRYATFASQCSMLWNQVKALGIELGQELMPTAKDLVGTAGDIVSWFSSLDSGTKRMIVNAGMVAASIGPVSTALGKVTGGAGSLITTISGAGAAFTAAGGGIAGVGSALMSIITPAGLVVAGLTAVVGIGFALYNASKKPTEGTKALGEAFSEVANRAKDFSNDIHTATSNTSEFASTLNGGFDMNDIKSKISEAQSKITAIVTNATKTRGYLVQSEIDKINEYCETIKELTDQQFDYYKNNLGALKSIAESELEMTSDTAKQILSDAQSYTQEALSLNDQARTEELATLQKVFDEDSAEYKKAEAEAQERFKNRKQDIKNSYAEITSIVAGAYAKQNLLGSDFYSKLQTYNSNVESEKKRHNDKIKEIHRDFAGDYQTMSAALYTENKDFQKNIDALNQDMANSFDSNSQQIIGTLTALLDEMQTNDGLITDETREFVEEFLACYDNLPDDVRSQFDDTIENMRDALESGKPSIEETAGIVAQIVPDIFKGAVKNAKFELDKLPGMMESVSQNAVTGTIEPFESKKNKDKIKTAVKEYIDIIPKTSEDELDENSPSKVMKGIGGFAIQGLINGMDEKKPGVKTSIGGIMQGALTAASSVSFVGVGQNIIVGIMSGLNDKKNSLLTAAGNIASSISSKIKSALKINSPSRVMMEIGEFTTAGMELGLMKGAESLYDTASFISAETAEALSGISAARLSYQQYPINDYSDKIDRLIEAVERLADSEPRLEVDGRPFGRLVREYV